VAYQTDPDAQVNYMEQETTSENKPVRDERGRLLPGNTANPNGRPVGSVSIIAELKKQLDEIANEDPQKRTKLVLLVNRMLLKAINDGDTQMIRDIIDRVHGKATQPIDVNTDDKVWDKLGELEKQIKNE